MWKSLKPATAIALALGLGGCASLESPTSLMPWPSDRDARPSVFPDKADIDGHMRLADASLKSGNQAAAISMYRRLAREYPMSLRPRIALGEALLAANAPQEAARAFEGALKLKGDSTQALVGLGRVELALHQPAKALENFDRAAKIDAKNTAAHNGRAVALDQLGRHEEAQAVYLDLLAKDPSNIRIRNNYALSLALAGKYDDSADILSGLAAAPDSETRIRQNLALVYGLSGNDGQAAHIARMDLDEDAVHNNLEYYQRLRHADTSAKGAALVSPAHDTLSSSAKPLPAPAKSARSDQDVQRAEEGLPAEPVRQPREYRAPKNAKSNGIAAEVSRAPRAIAPLPPLQNNAKQIPVADAEGKADKAASLVAQAAVSKAQEKAPGDAKPVVATKASDAPADSVAVAAKRASVPAVGPAPGAPLPVAMEPTQSEPVALAPKAKTGKPAQEASDRGSQAEAWAALEAASQSPVFEQKSAKRAAKAATLKEAPAGREKAVGKPAGTGARVSGHAKPAVDAKPLAMSIGATPAKSQPMPSGTTAETGAVKRAPLTREPLAGTSKGAVPAVPPVASLGEGISGSTRPAMVLRPSSGAAFHAPAVPKLKFRDQKAENGRTAAVPDKG